MKNPDVVLFINGNPLYLCEIRRDEHGNIKEAHVVNGAWQYHAKQIDENRLKISNHKDPIDKSLFVEVEVPRSKSDNRLESYHYNDVIHWAEQQLNVKG